MLSSCEMESKNASDMPGPDVDEIKDKSKDEDVDEEKDNDVDNYDDGQDGKMVNIKYDFCKPG